MAFERSYTVDWKNTQLRRERLDAILLVGEKNANVLHVSMTDGGLPASLTGKSAICYAVREEIGETVVMPASISGSTITATLSQSCYVKAGALTLLVMLTSGTSEETAVLVLDAYVQTSTTDTIYDPSGLVPSLSQLLASIDACKTATSGANAAAANANTAASQALSTASAAASQAYAAANAVTGITVAAQDGMQAGATVNQMDGHLHLLLTVPRGQDGAAGVIGTLADGEFAAYIDSDGYLVMAYNEGTTEPPFVIDADGYLCYVIGE